MGLLAAILLTLVFAIPGAHAQERPLAVGRVIADSLAPGSVHAFTLDLGADRFVFGAVEQLSVDVAVTILDPARERVARFDSPARGPEPFQFVSESAGTYRIEVRPVDEGTGRYAVTLEREEPRATTPEGRVDQIMAPYTGARPGGVVAVVRNGALAFARGYGMADLEHEAPNTPSTSWHMASISKQFTAFAIALLAEQGKLSLEDDVRTHIPELHDFGATITLRHLANHTSGLRDQWTLWVLSGGLMDDVIRQDDLLRLAYEQRALNFEPGSEYMYSNTGYTLLAEVVERVTDEAFGDWMRDNVFRPLGMNDTQIYDDHTRIVKGRAYSYENGADGMRKAVLSYANAGATSLFTTAEDLAKWVRSMRTHEVGGPDVWASMTTRGLLTNGDTIDYALGLGISEERGLRRISHGGADAGYRTGLSYYPEIDAGVIVLGNLASFNPGQVGAAVAEAFFEDFMHPEEERPAGATQTDEESFTVAPERMDAIAGEYRIDGGPIVRFTRESDGLVARIEGQPAFPLVALADTMFRVRVPNADVRVSFHVQSDGRIETGRIHQNGESPIRRITPWQAPDAAELAQYAGRYYSAELETFYTVRLDGNGDLVAWQRRHGEIELTAAGPDQFSSDRWFIGDVHFERDDAGRVTAMRFSSGRVRNLRLEKVRSDETGAGPAGTQ